MAIKTVNITELANIERSSGKVYPAGCTLIQVSATRWQVLYHAEQAEIGKYLDAIEKMEASEEATIELLKQAKQTNLSEMFAE